MHTIAGRGDFYASDSWELRYSSSYVMRLRLRFSSFSTFLSLARGISRDDRTRANSWVKGMLCGFVISIDAVATCSRSRRPSSLDKSSSVPTVMDLTRRPSKRTWQLRCQRTRSSPPGQWGKGATAWLALGVYMVKKAMDVNPHFWMDRCFWDEMAYYSFLTCC